MSELQTQLSKVDLNDEQVTPVSSESHVELPEDEAIFDGPDQIALSDAIVTTRADGPVKLIHEPYEPLSIPGLLSQMASKYPHHPAMVSRPDLNGHRKIYNYQDYETDVRSVAKAFIHLGLERHHSVAILGFNSPEWFICDLAAIYAGGIATGIYTTNSVDACQYCAEYSKANIIVVDDDKQLEKILKIKANLLNLKAIIQYEGTPDKEGVYSWADVLEIGRAKSDNRLDAVLKTIAVNECCTIVFTSGTIGNPKAVMLSHDNMISSGKILENHFKLTVRHEIIFSSFPLSNAAAQVTDLIMSLTVAATVHFADEKALKKWPIKTLMNVEPTFILSEPHLWQIIYYKLIAEIFPLLKKHKIESAESFLVLQKIKDKCGMGKLKLMLIGGKFLPEDMKKKLADLYLNVIEFRGMPESCGLFVFSSYDQNKLGSIGKVPKNFEIKLDSPDAIGEGEILIRGPHVFMGYLNDPEKTKEAIDEERWLHTGDLGKIDNDGFVYITGRIKELIITSGGENIPPLKIEQQLLKELPALSNAMLIGDDKKFLTVFLTFKTETNNRGEPLDDLTYSTKLWTKSIGSKATSVSEIITTEDPAVYVEIERAIERVNNCAINNAQKIEKFKVLPFDFYITGTTNTSKNICYVTDAWKALLIPGLFKHKFVEYEDTPKIIFKPSERMTTNFMATNKMIMTDFTSHYCTNYKNNETVIDLTLKSSVAPSYETFVAHITKMVNGCFYDGSHCITHAPKKVDNFYAWEIQIKTKQEASDDIIKNLIKTIVKPFELIPENTSY